MGCQRDVLVIGMSPTTFHMLFAFSWSVDKSLRKALAPFCVNVRSLNFFRQTDEVLKKHFGLLRPWLQQAGLLCDNRYI